MLEELGMKGTPTMGKARSLKEKRELAQELGTSSSMAMTMAETRRRERI